MNLQSRVLISILILVLNGRGFGQSKMDISIPDLFNLKQDAKTATRTPLDSRAVAMDAPLDASEYYLGPGDVLSLNTWSSAPSEAQLTVSPEGFLLIQNVGAVDVRDLTLAKTRSKVIPLVQKKYPGSDISLTLLSARKVSVQIAGQVMNEGILEMSSVQRVDHLIASANSLPPTQTTKDFYYQEIPRLRRDASERNISIRRRDGTMRRVDLIKYSITGESKYNPYLREGDMVYIPLRKSSDNNVGMLGGFIAPTNVEFVDGDSVTDLVCMGYGLKPLADTEGAFIARESRTGGIDTIRFDLKAIVEGRARNIAILPGDRLLVPESKESRAGEYVSVEGEVRRPGRYPISAYATSVRAIIAQCGGFTENANPVAATLVRGRPFPPNIPQQMALEQLMSARTAFTAIDSSYYLSETALRLDGELVSVDFHKLFLDRDTTADVTLRNFDKLTIPGKQRSIYVFGQVLQPGHVLFVSGKEYRYYIEKAKGYADDARTGDVKIIKAGSKIWLDPGETEIEDGDCIWVPKDYHFPFSYYLTTAVQIATVLGTLGTFYIIAKTIK